MSHNVTEGLAARVRDALDMRGRTQEWLANAMNEPTTTVHRKTVGKKYEFSPSELVEIAELLDVAPLSLLPDEFFQCDCAHIGSCQSRSGNEALAAADI